MKTIIYIASDVRSGSTMLDNLLSNHPKAESVGELAQLNSHLNRGKIGVSWDWKCTCGKAVDACPVWSRVAEVYEREHGHSLNDVETKVEKSARSRFFHGAVLLASLLPIKKSRGWLLQYAYRRERLEEIGRDLHRIIGIFSQSTDAEIVIDSSKRVEQLYALPAAKPADVELKVIHVVRDGRAVLYSKNKRAEQYKQYGSSFKLIGAIRGWCYVNLQILNMKCFFKAEDWMIVRYEDLCNDRPETLRRICEQFAIPFDEAMVHLASENKHNIGGTSHRFTWNAETPIRLDERWKAGLPRWQRMIYYLTAGAFHKRLGY